LIMSDYAEWDSPGDTADWDVPGANIDTNPDLDYSTLLPTSDPLPQGSQDIDKDLASWTSGVKDILGPYKTLFNKIKSGKAGAAEYSAAAGILGLLMPALNQPKTKGWKGSIDLNRQFTRTPIAQPAYTPYAQSAAPVMGRQFFNSSYSGAPAAAKVDPAAGGSAGDAATISPHVSGNTALPKMTMDDPYVNPDLQAAGAAEGGLMGYARGGRAMPPRYLRGQTDGMADKIPSNIDGVQPAKLSHGEFVIPADVVSHLGNGNSDAGAKVLYKMMDRVRQARTGNKKQGKRINPDRFTPGGIAGYAGGGAVAFQTGGATGNVNPQQAISNEQNISEWAGPYVGDMLSKTAALTNTPYQAYQGPLVAGTSPLQSKVFGGLESLDFPAQLGQTFSSSGAYTLPTPGAPGTPPSGPTGIASQYMNPYLSAVLTPQLEEMRRQSEISRKNLGSKFGGAGGAGAFSAMGGGRHAIESAELERNMMQEQNKAIGTGYSNAYDRAMGQFNTEQQQARSLADMMEDAGQKQRGIEQEGITALQKQYETELLDPYTKLRFQKEMLQGLPVATASTTANQSTMGQLGGSFEDIGKLMKQLGLS
jgi:hypothetical protein